MDQKRYELDGKLREILGSDHLYFQPTESVRLKYPCIIYSKVPGDVKHADNRIYLFTDRYELTFICSDPDSIMPYTLMDVFSMIHWDRRFVADNLYHDVFTLYY